MYYRDMTFSKELRIQIVLDNSLFVSEKCRAQCLLSEEKEKNKIKYVF